MQSINALIKVVPAAIILLVIATLVVPGADLCRRLGRATEARVSYERALALTQQEPERRFLEKRLVELG